MRVTGSNSHRGTCGCCGKPETAARTSQPGSSRTPILAPLRTGPPSTPSTNETPISVQPPGDCRSVREDRTARSGSPPETPPCLALSTRRARLALTCPHSVDAKRLWACRNIGQPRDRSRVDSTGTRTSGRIEMKPISEETLKPIPDLATVGWVPATRERERQRRRGRTGVQSSKSATGGDYRGGCSGGG